MLIFGERECNYFRRELKGRLLKPVSSLGKGLIKGGSGERFLRGEMAMGVGGSGRGGTGERWLREEVTQRRGS